MFFPNAKVLICLLLVFTALTISSQDCPVANSMREGNCLVVKYSNPADAIIAVSAPAETLIVSESLDGKSNGVYIAQSLYSADEVIFTGAGPCIGGDYTDVVQGTLSFTHSGLVCTYDNQGLLPVSYSYFTIKQREEGMAQLEWATSTEVSNEGFYLEKSTDGRNFIEFAYVEGAGFSNSELEYSFTERDLNPGMNYYRLRQIDFDGAERLSEVIQLNYTSDNPTKIFFNKDADQLVIHATRKIDFIEVYTVSGSRVLKNLIRDDNTEQIVSVQSLEDGPYVVSIVDDLGNRSTHKFVHF